MGLHNDNEMVNWFNLTRLDVKHVLTPGWKARAEVPVRLGQKITGLMTVFHLRSLLFH